MIRHRAFGLVLLCFALFGKTTLGASRYLLLLDNIPQLTSLVKPDQVVYTEKGISVVRVDVREVERWSELVHRRLGGCGGFVDVTGSLRQGLTPKEIVQREIASRRRPPVYLGLRPQYRGAVASFVGSGDAKRFWEYIARLTAFSDRSASTETGVKAAQYIYQFAQDTGKSIPGFRAALINTGTEYPQPSVMTMIPGSDPSLGGVVLGAHLDTLSNDKPGADDDGSGSAAVMEVLTSIASSKAKFKRTLYLLWYAAEERGLVGSNYVVKYFTQNKLTVRAAIQLDMVGYNAAKDAQDIYMITDNTHQELNVATQKLIESYVGAKVGTTKCGYSCSDHVNWHRAGIPVVFPFESAFENYNPYIHTKNDTQNLLDQAHGFRFVQTALAFLGEMGEVAP